MLAVLDDEQRLLSETARRIAAALGVSQPQQLATWDESSTAAAWRELAKAGLLGLRRRVDGRPVASGVEAMIVAHETGAHLVPVSFAFSGVLVPELLELAHADDGLLDEVVQGSLRLGLLMAPSLLGPAEPADRDAVLLGARQRALALRPGNDGHQLVLVTTEHTFAPIEAADLTAEIALRAAGGTVDDADVVAVGRPIAPDDLTRWTALALTLVSADCAGAMRAALDGVVEYTKHRIAYGVPIGTFQALQHLCADAYTACEAAVTSNNHAAWAVDALPPPEALLAARTAKAWVAAVGRDVAEVVMQVYGGIGQTWDHVAHVYTRRILGDIALFGAESHQLDEIFELRQQGG